MNHVPLAILTVLVAVALAAPGGALHCNGNISTIDAGGETFYIDDRSDQPSEIDHWVYQEWNGQEGLQSGSPNYLIEPPLCSLGVNVCYDPCTHQVPDRLIL